MVTPLDRRSFLRLSGLSLAGAALAAAGLPACQGASLRPARRAPKSGPLALGIIGVGGRGADNLAAVGGENIAALCDVDSDNLAIAAKQFPSARLFRDWREMLAGVALDAVVISTPDHTHAPATLAALDAGLDVYCEKPLAHTVEEVRAVMAAAAWRGAVTQMGTQIHATDNYRRVVELVRAGAIGTVRQAHCWVSKSWGGGERPTDTPPVPASLDWELWLGTAPRRPYHPTYHPAGWRRFWDFGTGTLGDMGCHHLDLPFWALGLQRPGDARAFGPPPNAETASVALRVRWSFPGLELWWHDGGLRPPQFDQGVLPDWGDGTLFLGDDGMLLADYGHFVLLPEERFRGFVPPAPTIASSVGHHKEWLDACRTRGATSCDFRYSGLLAETVLRGVEAYRRMPGSADNSDMGSRAPIRIVAATGR